MSVIKVEDIAFVRFAAPRLDEMQRFLEAFGMTAGPDTGDGALRMRGAGPAPFLHETVVGDARFRGVGLRAANVADLQRLADAEGQPVEALAGPGGGQVVRLTDPDGIHVDVVAGQATASSATIDDLSPWNTAAARSRVRAVRPARPGAATVVRLGHAVLRVSDLRRSERWWKDRFGFITSDEVLADADAPFAIFMRCDRGVEPTDHHTVTLGQAAPGERTGFHHAAFEVRDFDDLMAGHDHLAAQGYEAVWGVGRHVVGGQVFDYWLDPFGHRIEHWTDGDLFTAADGSNVIGTDVMFRNHWGPPPSQRFIDA